MPIARSHLFREMRGAFKNLDVRYRKNKKIELASIRIPSNPRTEKQQKVRKAYGRCVQEWHSLSDEEREDYNRRAALYGLSGFNLYVKERLPELLALKFDYEITITERSGSDLHDYQILLDISNDADFFSACENEHKYLEFYDDDKATLLNHWIELWDAANNSALIWIKVPLIHANSTKKIYLRINKSRTEPLSSGAAVFDFFDDFETWEGWTQYGSGKVAQDDARAYDGTYSAHKTTANDPNGAYKLIGQTLGRNIALHFRVNRNSAYAGGPADRIGILNSDGNGYGWGYKHDADELFVDKRTDYEGTTYGNVGVTDEMDAWSKGILKITSDTIYAERYLSDGTPAGSTSLTDTAYTNFDRVYIFGGYDYWVDQMFIRKYTDPEPSVAYQKIS